jgi:SagB-type dehydrogenase family enzyme
MSRPIHLPEPLLPAPLLENPPSPAKPKEEPAGRSLVDFWNESRLRADQAKSTTVRPAPGVVPWRAALEDVLKVGYGVQSQSRFVGGAWELVRWRTVPSAGALYPFEVIASVVGEGSWLWDLEQGRLVPCNLAPLTRDDLDAAGFVTPPGERAEALLIFLARPWLSMRKYRGRGYPYCHLDVGHVTTNLALYTTALGHAPTLHLRFSHDALARHLELGGLCREPLAVLSFTAEPAAAPPTVAGFEEEELPPVGLERPDGPELANWKTLRGLLSFDSALAPPRAPAAAPLLREPAAVAEDAVLPLPAGRPQAASARTWRSAILGRRSAKGFRAEPLSLAHVGELLGAIRDDGLPADGALDPAARLGVRLVARNVDGLAGVFAYAPREHALLRLAAPAGDPGPACMRQEIARDAAALLLLHSPICRLVARQEGYSAFAELHFHAAQLAQRLYLAAARLGTVGMTCIGGFDGLECATLAGLDPDDETLYVILLGVPDEAATKHDRLNVAFSHGYTTRED